MRATKPFTIQSRPALSHNRMPATLPIPVFVYLSSIILPISFELGSFHLTAIRLFLIVIIIPLGVNLLRGCYGKLLATDLLFTLHIAWVITALIINDTPGVIQSFGSTGLEFLGGYLVGRAYIRDQKSFVALCKLFGVLIAVCLPVALFEALTGIAVVIAVLDQLPWISAPTDLEIQRRLGIERVQLSFEHPIHWGLFNSFAAALCFIGLKTTYSLWIRSVLLGCAVLGSVLSVSSGAIISILLQMGIIAWAYIFHNLHRKWLILLITILAAYVSVDLASNRTPLQVFMSYATFSAHSAYWRSTIFDWGLLNIQMQPFFGLGFKDWLRPEWMHTPSIDNFWLLIAMRFGVPAFSFLIFGYGWALRRISQRNFDHLPAIKAHRQAWIICVIGLGFALTTVHIWGAIYSLTFFIVGSGMWLVTTGTQGAVTTPAKVGPIISPRAPNLTYCRTDSTLAYSRRRNR